MTTADGATRNSVGGAIYMGSSQAVRLILLTLSTIVVARLVPASDYGVIAMSWPVLAFVTLFQDLGLSQATIQSSTLSPGESSGMFWLNILVALGTAVVMVLLGPLVAIFYHDPRPGYVVAASAANILISSASLQHVALLNRAFSFQRLALVDVLGSVSTFIITIFAATILRNYWALWMGTAIGLAVSTAAAWIFSDFRPDYRPSIARIDRMAKFGGLVTGSNLATFIARTLDNILIARVWGAEQLGLYDRSYRLMLVPLQNINVPLGRVMLPLLSRMRDEPKTYRSHYLLVIRCIQITILPAFGVAAGMSGSLIVILLGHKWSAAGPIFFWLSLAGLLQPLPNTTSWLFVSSGRVREQLRVSIASVAVMVTGFVIGLHWGALGVAASVFVTSLLRLPIFVAHSVVGTHLRARDLYLSMAEPLLGAAVGGIVASTAQNHIPAAGGLAIGLVSAYGTALLLCLLSSQGRSVIAAVLRHSPFRRPA